MMNESTLISLALGATFLLSAVSSGRAESGDEGQAAPLFPLMGWGGMEPTERHVKGLAECGMTLANFAPGSALNLCHEYGLNLIIQDPRLRYDWDTGDADEIERGLRAVAREFGDHPACYGYYLRDEPNAADFANLGRSAHILRDVTPDKAVYVNLFPNYASREQLGTQTYREHLDRYCDEFKPTFISYDNYFAMIGDEVLAEYYQNLESVRDVSLERGVPFWNIILSTAHYGYRIPSEGDMHFQVFTTLAYGGKGISYFTYFTPRGENFRMGPIDHFGGRTPVWDMVRRCNGQVRSLAPHLLKLNSTGVYHAPEAPAEECRKLPGDTLVKSVSGGQFLIGEFVHEDGSQWFLVVNLNRSECALFNVDVGGRKVRSVSNYTGQLEGHLDNWLLPGQGKLCRVE